jgi:membrane protein
MMSKFIDDLKARFTVLAKRYESVCILRQTFQRFSQVRAAQAAASLAYYAFFSLFPLLLGLVVIASLVVSQEQAYQMVTNLLGQGLPVSQQLIRDTISRVLDTRGSLGILSLIGFIWSASNAFNALVRNVNLAWPTADNHPALKRRLMAIGIVLFLALMLILSFVSSTVIRILPNLDIPIISWITETQDWIWRVSAILVPLLISYILFLVMYHFVPNTGVSWPAALGGALFTSVAWELAKSGIVWYFNSGLVRYEVVYGSLTTVVTLMFWIYISSLIALLGAHLTAAVDRCRAPSPPAEDEIVVQADVM